MHTRTIILTIAIFLPGLFACSDNADTASNNETPTTVEVEETQAKETAAKKSGNDADGPLAAESGMIEYALEGIQSGKIIKYWRKHGMETAELHDTSMNVMGMITTEKKWLIMTPEAIYNIDQAANTATRAENPATAMTSNMNRNQMQEFGKEMLQQMGKRNGTKDVAGKTCDLWTITGMGSEVCIWEGLDLYTSSNMAGMGMTRTAVKIETGKVDSKHFEVPATIQVTDMGNPLDWQEQMKRAQEMMPK